MDEKRRVNYNLDPKYADRKYRDKNRLGPVPWWIKVAQEHNVTPLHALKNPAKFGHRKAWDPTCHWQLHLI